MSDLPCSWDVSCEICPDLVNAEQEHRDAALWLASSFLWGATGRQYGVCSITVRPSQPRFEPAIYQAYPTWPGQGAAGGPFLFGGRWFNSGCTSACCGSNACAIVLRGPIAAVDEVLIDGEAVPSSAYRVDVMGGAWWLVRTDGDCWPTCQRASANSGEEGAFEVTYDFGRALPESLSIATAMLACEYVKLLTTGTCSLPARMTSLTRQGVTVEVDSDNPHDGTTGIKYVDQVISTLNPGRRQYPPVILSPDMPEACDRMTVIGPGS